MHSVFFSAALVVNNLDLQYIILQLLKTLVERRKMVKSWMGGATGLKLRQFDIQQQALKLTANRFVVVFYSLSV